MSTPPQMNNKGLRFRYRPFRPGDEVRINELYYIVTGRRRSIEQFRWQWQDAPGGKGEIWLIELVREDGSTKLIGHHGVMPIYFSFGERDLLAGKTENTMVHPDFRNRILYPRFEKKFLSNYEKRFDLLFSTLGPPSAIRQRVSHGYEASKQWLHFEWILSYTAILIRISSYLKHLENRSLKSIGHVCYILSKSFNDWQRSNFASSNINQQLKVLNSEMAKKHPFFDRFWDKARHEYGLTPRRNKCDLQWRFWDNPYGGYTTVLFNDHKSSGYAIIRNLNNSIYTLEDIVIFPLCSNSLIRFMQNICNLVKTKGGVALRFSTTNDNHPITNTLCRFPKNNLCDALTFLLRKHECTFMPRKFINPILIKEHLHIKCYITPFVFEGRI